ncbi:hypothetical protein [Arthrobacter sp. ISL-65]|uniref:hypothetical protein n=1 Tax=Arthrobacter sp. ISL-65 TaxID=2819112 RepID=UPI001BE89C2A|nr:hypothetical protein [Arthrobacter sp. ISL-65]MBT2550555.1 hypothetical protein [Arthrobacter sp. ISL-65]
MEKKYEVEVDTESPTAPEDGKALAMGAAQIQLLAAADGYTLTDAEALQDLHVEGLGPGSTKFKVSKTIEIGG